MDSSVNYPEIDTRSIKAAVGFLPLTVAPAAGGAAMMAASAFGALTALTATARGVGWADELFGTGGFGSERHSLRARPRATERSG
jgi:hypothetical protein